MGWNEIISGTWEVGDKIRFLCYVFGITKKRENKFLKREMKLTFSVFLQKQFFFKKKFINKKSCDMFQQN